ncbi:MAG: S1 family peptidase [Actinomycetota bacterium]|nr:S1 family peptidase [Actinomycetota bacterium]
MAFSDFIDDPYVTETVDSLSQQLLGALQAQSQRRLELAYVQPPPTVVFGAAAVVTDDKAHPALLVNSALAAVHQLRPGQLTPVAELGELRGMLEESLRADVPGNVQALPVPEPQPCFAPAETVSGPIKRGTLGARVTTANGSHAILTAGHVATTGTVVHDGGNHPGKVVFSVDPAQVPALVVTVDVAVISADCWDPHAGATVVIGGQAELTGGMGLAMHGSVSGVKLGVVMGRSPFIHVPSMSGQWDDCYFTTAGISQDGDSGAPVLADGADHVVGHLVGASGKITSYIQAINPQLAAAGVTLRP